MAHFIELLLSLQNVLLSKLYLLSGFEKDNNILLQEKRDDEKEKVLKLFSNIYVFSCN